MTSSGWSTKGRFGKRKGSHLYRGQRTSGSALEGEPPLFSRAWGTSSRTDKGSSRVRSESISGVFPKLFRNFTREFATIVWVSPAKMSSYISRKISSGALPDCLRACLSSSQLQHAMLTLHYRIVLGVAVERDFRLPAAHAKTAINQKRRTKLYDFPGKSLKANRPTTGQVATYRGSTIAASFPKMALTGQKIAVLDMVLLPSPASSHLPSLWTGPEFPSEVLLSCATQAVVVDRSQLPAKQ